MFAWVSISAVTLSSRLICFACTSMWLRAQCVAMAIKIRLVGMCVDDCFSQHMVPDIESVHHMMLESCGVVSAVRKT